MRKINITESQLNYIIEGKSKSKKYTVYINGKKDEIFSNMNWKRKPKIGKGFYYGGAVFKIKDVTDDSIYAIEESTELQTSNVVNESYDYFDMFELAKEHFGITNDIRECGYILPDGTMLDFSGRHTLNKGTDSSHLAGRRGIDHRNVYEIGWSEDGNTKYFDFAMEDFIKLGAIRIHASKTYALINLYKKPTSQQIPLLIRLIQYAKGCVDVEIGDGNESLSYGEFDNAKPNAVIAKINRFFDEKISLDESIVDWAVDNLPQYRKQIMAGKNGYIPMRTVYDQETNKIKREPYPLYKNESIKKYLTLLKEESLLGEEFNADGNTTSNPYKKRWDAERKALKDFVCMYGKLMQSKEDDKNGKLYKCFWDKTLSNLIGYNYCLAVQYDEINNKPKSTIYVRACDRFTPNIRRNLQYDARGHDNQMGTYDDIKNYGIV